MISLYLHFPFFLENNIIVGRNTALHMEHPDSVMQALECQPALSSKIVFASLRYVSFTRALVPWDPAPR